MVKVKDFWNHLCNDLEYRFFAGVACPGFKLLYRGMSSEFMHYIPAVNERVALGLVSGAYVGGFKGGLLLDSRFFPDLTRLLNFNSEYKIPFLILSYGQVSSGLSVVKFNKLSDLDKADKLYKKELLPVVVSIEEGMLS